MQIGKLSVLLLLFIYASGTLFASSYVKELSLPLQFDVHAYKLADSPIINHSESIWADSLLLLRDIDYKINYHDAILHLPSIPQASNIYVRYILVPTSLNKTLQTWESKTRSDSLFTTLKRKQVTGFNTDAKLDIQGVKTFAITFSDNESFDLKQSLYVNLSGELSKGVSISAQLSDSQSKLSPEGDSKELSSLDQVFIKIYGDKFELAMGDLELKWNNSRYLEYYSKFEGLKFLYSDKHSLQAAYSAGSGKSASTNLDIVDGKQGPYYLRANDYQPGFIVIAGSEEVFVDGLLWERGVGYTIDYSEGSLMFKRLISSNNSVLVRFHYSDEFFPSTSYLNSSAIKLTDNITIKHHFIWQQDDKNNPLLFEFSDSDLDSLSAAGDTRAWGEGVVQVDPGLGSYRKEISITGIEYYVYAYPDSTATYNINFSFVGSGNGDYTEFSPGKFRYAGVGLGAWLPRKQLIAPTHQGNLDVAIDYTSSLFQAGMEAIGTIRDKNTLSGFDDSDNQGGILYSYAQIPIRDFEANIDHEMRSANSSLFGKYRSPEMEFDLSGIETADSLKQSETNLGISHKSMAWEASLKLRYKDVNEYYQQRAIRFNSSTIGKGILPAINLRSTLSEQTYEQEDAPKGILQYHQASAAWDTRLARVQIDWLLNRLENGNTGSLYEKIMPSLRIGNSNSSLTQISYSDDTSKIKNNYWIQSSNNQTYAVRQLINTELHNLDIDYTHRELSQPGNTNSGNSRYDLMNLRSNHTIIHKAISIFQNYQLNQTEFFPKIRELQYLGSGLGYYDSTGVSINNGDYDYVYVNAGEGKLSTEINALWSIYIKPATLGNSNFYKKWHSDMNISLTEQSANRNNWKSYLFLPGEVFNDSNTIYGRQSLQNNLWIDLIRNKITGNLQLNMDRSLDKRYQSSDRSANNMQALQLDIKSFNSYNTRLQISHDTGRDSRYQSQTETQAYIAIVQRNFVPANNIQTELSYKQESGGKQDGSENYRLHSYYLSPTFRSIFMQKYRINTGLSVQHNKLDGSNYFSFLPQKRDGWIFGANVNGVYRMNSFSSITLEYRYTDYPKEKNRHELKLEFKAEL